MEQFANFVKDNSSKRPELLSDVLQTQYKSSKKFKDHFNRFLFQSNKLPASEIIVNSMKGENPSEIKTLSKDESDLLKKHEKKFAKCGHYRNCFSFKFVNNSLGKSDAQIIQDCLNEANNLHQTYDWELDLQYFQHGNQPMMEPSCSYIGK